MNHAIVNRHPAALKVFFATEMWERYGFYVVQALLALYMAKYYNWSDQNIYALVGSFTALAYLSPILGGWIADKLLGQKKSILIGATILCINYIILTLIHSKHGLLFALSGITVGTGLLKPNISSLLGNQYPPKSPHKEAGFTLFYMGITTGIIFGTTIPSKLNQLFEWSIPFGSAALGLIIAFSIFSIGIKRYAIQDYYQIKFSFKKAAAAALPIGMLWYIAYMILVYPYCANIAFLSVICGVIGYLTYTIKHEEPMQAKQTIVIALLCLISVMFWAFYFQMFMSLTLFLSRVVRPTVMGLQFPPPYYVAIQSIGMLIFGYYLSRESTNINKFLAKESFNTSNKFLLAMFFMCAAYILITIVIIFNHDDQLLSPWYFIPAYLLISIAELLLSPVGLSAITTLAAKRKVSTMMGIFFISLGMGSFLSGKLAAITAIKNNFFTIQELKVHYASSFSLLLCILLVATLIAVITNIAMRRLLSTCKKTYDSTRIYETHVTSPR